MSLGLQRGKVKLVPHDPEWIELFRREAANIKGLLRDRLLGIEQIGSTAVPDLDAKPILDLMVAVESIDEFEGYSVLLRRLGYEFRRDNRKEQEHILCVKGPEENRTHYLKLTTPGSEFWSEHILFRDYLLHHPERLKAYQKLKRDLFDKHAEDRALYTDGKAQFIKETIDLARKELETRK